MEEIELDRIVHVYPIAGPEHICDGDKCWCNPEHELVQGLDDKYGLILVHRLIHWR